MRYYYDIEYELFDIKQRIHSNNCTKENTT